MRDTVRISTNEVGYREGVCVGREKEREGEKERERGGGRGGGKWVCQSGAAPLPQT